MKFTPKELTLISRALRVAEIQYEIDAQALAEYPRTAEAFRLQRDEARRLADRIDQEG